ncbi:hypothetical protein LTS15_002077 [Exophiala xenobiotica]|nr:hypothetical protein LTS15_002077 [Exophiala xenobiotica]
MDDKIQDLRHTEEANGNFDPSWREEQWGNKKLSVAAHDFTRDEKEMTIREAVVANKKAIFWSLVISTCVIMEGYDTNHLGNFYAYPKVQQLIGQEGSDYFKGFERRRTEIAMVVFGGQVVCGLCFAYASTYFFQQVGLDSDAAYSLGLGANGMALFAYFCNWFFLMPYFGRRAVYVIGMAAIAIELCIIGILNPWTHMNPVGWAQAIMALIWTFTFQLSAGQLGWALPAEIGSTRLRQKTLCLARNVSNVTGVIGGTLENYFMNPEAWSLRGYAGRET